MKSKIINLFATLLMVFMIHGCFDNGNSSKMADITKENYDKIIESSFKSVGLVNTVIGIEDDILEAIGENEENYRKVAQNSDSCQDGGTIVVEHKDNKNKKSITINANNCREDGIYLDGSLQIDIEKSKIDANRTKIEYKFSFSKFIYENGENRLNVQNSKTQKIDIKTTTDYGNGNISYEQEIIKIAIDINGYVKNRRSAADFKDFSFNFDNNNHYFFAFNGNIKFKDTNKWIDIKTLKSIELDVDKELIKDGKLKVLGKSSYLIVIFNKDNTYDIYYNGIEHVKHDTAKSIINNMR